MLSIESDKLLLYELSNDMLLSESSNVFNMVFVGVLVNELIIWPCEVGVFNILLLHSSGLWLWLYGVFGDEVIGESISNSISSCPSITVFSSLFGKTSSLLVIAVLLLSWLLLLIVEVLEERDEVFCALLSL